MVQLVFDGGAKGICIAGAGHLAQRTGLTRRGVQRILDRLEERGFIEIRRRPGQDSAIRWRTPVASVPGSLATEGRHTSDRGSPEVATVGRGKAVDKTPRLTDGIELTHEGENLARETLKKLRLRATGQLRYLGAS